MTINISEEPSTDAPALTDALRAVEKTNENNSIGPQQGLFHAVIDYVCTSAEDVAETKGDISGMQDGLECGA